MAGFGSSSVSSAPTKNSSGIGTVPRPVAPVSQGRGVVADVGLSPMTSTPMTMASTPLNSTSGNLQQLMPAITNMLSQPAQQQVPAISNQATANPVHQQAQNQLMQRAQTDMGAKDAMRMSGQANADNAAMLMADARKGASRRGVGNSSVGDVLSAGIASDANRANAATNAKIGFESERAKDAQLFGVGSMALQGDESQGRQIDRANDQYATASNAALSQQRLQQEKLRSVLDLLGPIGGFF